MTPKQEALALVRQYGAELQDWGSDRELWGDVWSPPGIVFVASGGHCLAMAHRTNRPAGWKALLGDLSLGVSPCTDAACETCHPGPR